MQGFCLEHFSVFSNLYLRLILTRNTTLSAVIKTKLGNYKVMKAYFPKNVYETNVPGELRTLITSNSLVTIHCLQKQRRFGHQHNKRRRWRHADECLDLDG